MTPGDDDRELREQFGALRRADARRAPGFAGTWERARSGHRERAVWRPTLVRASAAAALLALGLLLLFRAPIRVRPPRAAAVPSIMQWKPATDFLLRTPGQELLRTLPRIGGALPFPAPTPSQRRPS